MQTAPYGVRTAGQGKIGRRIQGQGLWEKYKRVSAKLNDIQSSQQPPPPPSPAYTKPSVTCDGCRVQYPESETYACLSPDCCRRGDPISVTLTTDSPSSMTPPGESLCTRSVEAPTLCPHCVIRHHRHHEVQKSCDLASGEEIAATVRQLHEEKCRVEAKFKHAQRHRALTLPTPLTESAF